LPKVLAFVACATLHAHPCESCHPKEVAAYAHSSMARSLRRPANEPAGTFTTASGTRFTIRSDSNGTWQRMERFGGSVEYPVAYVIGSGSHASGYLIQVGDHLFQSPVCYYTKRKAYNLSPGYEQTTEPDFTRPVGEECVLCHSGLPQHVAGTPNQYRQPVFLEESISCQRCHGLAEEHLKRTAAGSIVNPAKLARAARDSVCEQCHLVGATQRILNPGKNFADFHAGQPLEDFLSVYTRPGVRGFRVISHSEQLALSACARQSAGKLWCGTCHDPHPPTAPTALTYNRTCRSCHEGKLAKSHPAAPDCIGCHMQRRPAPDGGHTVFTDHRITRRPEADTPAASTDELVAWREPDPTLRPRNLALAYVEAGLSAHSVPQLVRGYTMLAELQPSMPGDVAVLKGIGRALQAGGKPLEALKAFEWVLRLAPDNASNEMDVGINDLASGKLDQAASHLERALELDPLLLSAGTALQQAYRKQGNEAGADALAEKMRRAMIGK
jgi:predicted CXXCH cytochrome family protein